MGYASGAVWSCAAAGPCHEFGGTPNAPVRRIAVSGSGGREVVWVAYKQGALYRCEEQVCVKSARIEAHN